MGLDPRILGSRPGPKADAQPLSHSGIPTFVFQPWETWTKATYRPVVALLCCPPVGRVMLWKQSRVEIQLFLQGLQSVENHFLCFWQFPRVSKEWAPRGLACCHGSGC